MLTECVGGVTSGSEIVGPIKSKNVKSSSSWDTYLVNQDPNLAPGQVNAIEGKPNEIYSVRRAGGHATGALPVWKVFQRYRACETNEFRVRRDTKPWNLTTRRPTGKSQRTRSQKCRPTTNTPKLIDTQIQRGSQFSKRTRIHGEFFFLGTDAQKARVPASRFSWRTTFCGDARVGIGLSVRFLDIL